LEPEPGTGNINTNPIFTDFNNFTYLEFSPCIDQGDPNLLDPDESRSDIGANFYNDQLLGDCNNDNFINVVDIVGIIDGCILGSSQEDCSCGDLNSDELVNVVDIVLLVSIVLGN
jgi:hypothetical protein